MLVLIVWSSIHAGKGKALSSYPFDGRLCTFRTTIVRLSQKLNLGRHMLSPIRILLGPIEGAGCAQPGIKEMSASLPCRTKICVVLTDVAKAALE